MSTPEGTEQPPPGYQPPAFQSPAGYPPPPYQPPYYAPPGYQQPQPGAPFGVDMYGRPYSDKNKIVAGVLQLAFGTVGAGRWYTGHYGIAIAQLLTCGGLGVWAIIDGILMLVDKVTDPQGRPLRG